MDQFDRSRSMQRRVAAQSGERDRSFCPKGGLEVEHTDSENRRIQCPGCGRTVSLRFRRSVATDGKRGVIFYIPEHLEGEA